MWRTVQYGLNKLLPEVLNFVEKNGRGEQICMQLIEISNTVTWTILKSDIPGCWIIPQLFVFFQSVFLLHLIFTKMYVIYKPFKNVCHFIEKRSKNPWFLTILFIEVRPVNMSMFHELFTKRKTNQQNQLIFFGSMTHILNTKDGIIYLWNK